MFHMRSCAANCVWSELSSCEFDKQVLFVWTCYLVVAKVRARSELSENLKFKLGAPVVRMSQRGIQRLATVLDRSLGHKVSSFATMGRYERGSLVLLSVLLDVGALVAPRCRSSRL